MPRYFLNIVVRGRRAIPDPEGDELPGDKEARKHAKMVARNMLDQSHRYKRGLEHWVFVITDESERLVGVVPFTSAAAKPKGATLKFKRDQ